MRILLWTEGFWPRVGGVEIYTKQFIPAIRAKGYEVTVITPLLAGYLEEEEVEGAHVYRLPFYEVLFGRDPGEFMALKKQVEKIRQDFAPHLVHAIIFGPSILFHTETNKRQPIPTVVAIHSDLTRANGLGNIIHSAMSQASWITAVSAATLDDLTVAFPQIRGKSSYIYNGLKSDGFLQTPLPRNPPQLLCLGRLVNIKGFDLAIEALAKLRQDIPCARLTIAGDGEERQVLEQQVQALGLDGAVRFTGWVPSEEVNNLIGEATVVLVPSRCRETFSLVAVEAALMGRPVVAAKAGGLEEVVVDGETGFLVDMNDSFALAQSLRLILTEPALMEKLGRNASVSARQRFTIEANAASYDALYRRLMAEATA